jgi:hypothetical protein
MRDFYLHATHQVANSLHAGSPVKAEAVLRTIQRKQFSHSAAHAVVVSARPNSRREQALASLTTTVRLVDVQCVVLFQSSLLCCLCVYYTAFWTTMSTG